MNLKMGKSTIEAWRDKPKKTKINDNNIPISHMTKAKV